MMRRHELWRQQYRKRRYLEYLDMEELDQRMRDLLCNMMVLTTEGKIGLRAMVEGGSYWIELFTHGLEEYGIRNKNFREKFMEKAILPRPTWPKCPRSVEVMPSKKMEPSKYLIKYGKFHYLDKAYNEGILRIFPASKYKDQYFNPAIQDNELNKSIYGLPGETRLEIFDRNAGMSKGTIKSLSNIKFTKESTIDYFVYCLSCVYDFRLFDDFAADCCLIIHEPKEFTKRLHEAFVRKVPTQVAYYRRVHYMDPLNSRAEDFDVYSSKHFRYAYQNEYRFIWIPLQTQNALEWIDLEINCLKEMAELIRLA